MLLCHFICNNFPRIHFVVFIFTGCAILKLVFYFHFSIKSSSLNTIPFHSLSKKQKNCEKKEKNRIIWVWFWTQFTLFWCGTMHELKCNWVKNESIFLRTSSEWLLIHIHSAILFTHVDITPSTQYTIVNLARGPTMVFFPLSFQLMKRKYLFHDSHPQLFHSYMRRAMSSFFLHQNTAGHLIYANRINEYDGRHWINTQSREKLHCILSCWNTRT